jgi:hypothetical protein
MCIAEGIEVLELHHLVKRGANGGRPTTLADLYGSTWLTSGAGSVILLGGDAGDPIVELLHLKTPAAEVGPWRVIHDHDAGTSSIWHAADLVMMAKAKGAAGLTAKAAAVALFTTEKPTPSQVEKARRKLNALTKSGQLDCIPGDDATARPTAWTPAPTLTDTLTHPSEPVTPHAPARPSRRAESEHEYTLTDTLTTLTRQDPHACPPSYKEGTSESEAEPTCTDCTRRLSKADQSEGVCIQCRRIRAAEAAS